MKIEIKTRFLDNVLFSHECENNSIAITVQAAINAKIDLRCADFHGEDLRGSDFHGEDLRGSDFREADLRCTDFRGTNLRGADLRGAKLDGADIYEANLGRTDLGGADLGESGKLTGARPFFQVGPIGSRSDSLLAFQTEKGVFLRSGHFFGAIEKFREELRDDVHAKEYTAALGLIQAHYEAWPATIERE